MQHSSGLCTVFYKLYTIIKEWLFKNGVPLGAIILLYYVYRAGFKAEKFIWEIPFRLINYFCICIFRAVAHDGCIGYKSLKNRQEYAGYRAGNVWLF